MTYGDCLLLLFLLYVFIVDVHASVGDRSLSFRKCLSACKASDCLLEGQGTVHFALLLPV